MTVEVDENGTLNTPHWALSGHSLTWYGLHHAGILTDDELLELWELLNYWKENKYDPANIG